MRAGAWNSAASFLTKGMGFLTVPLFTRLMTTEEFGTFNALAAVQTLFVVVFGLEAYRTVNRARFDFDRDELQRYQFSMLCLGVILTSVLGIAYWAVPEFFTSISGIPQEYLFAI